ncbi:thioredoxin family protein [Fodinibius salsisoli]|uniref:Thioredoxin family protein n=1 Tax=Fodinibius salsisoli TaxID=2820877 RepID=A0ABT3PJS2_9BACT|nr:thioredoxin family protein [Fodinibius salsisoli]MCW9705998.1 thioredoxin family protein [Fodinibius salsisoli]
MSQTAEQLVTPEIIADAMSYREYRTLIDDLLDQGKTTGSNHSEAMLNYTKMNVQRMRRLDKQLELTSSLKKQIQSVDEDWVWLVLTEAWCGDAAQNIPGIAKMAEQNDHIELKFILRDEHLDIMDEYLTNGGRSIPKLICFDADTLEEIGTWGPRPGEFQQKAMEWKDDPEISKKEWAKKLHKWYADDKGKTLQADFETLIAQWS